MRMRSFGSEFQARMESGIVPYSAAMDVLDLARGGNITVGVLPDKLAD